MKEKEFLGSVIVVLCFLAFLVLMTYRGPAVRFERVNNSLYVNIENGMIGMNCYNETGAKVIATSHFFGPKRMLYVSDLNAYTQMYTFRISCIPYYAYNGPPITATFTVDSCYASLTNMCTAPSVNSNAAQ